jgi:hypothetical protein
VVEPGERLREPVSKPPAVNAKPGLDKLDHR